MKLSLKVITILLTAIFAFSVHADESGQDLSDRYTSIRGSIYKKRIARFDEAGYDAKFKLQVSTTLYKYKSFDEFLDPDTKHFNSLGLRPVFQLTIPTRWQNIRFIPTAELQLTRRFDLNRTLLSGSVSGMLRYEDESSEGYITAYGSLKYGTRYDNDGLNLEDYVRMKYKAALNRSLDWSIGEHAQHIIPFVSASYYFNDFRLGESEDIFTDVDTEYEVGMKFSSRPRMKLWKVRVPEIEFSFTFGDEVKGFKIRF